MAKTDLNTLLDTPEKNFVSSIGYKLIMLILMVFLIFTSKIIFGSISIYDDLLGIKKNNNIIIDDNYDYSMMIKNITNSLFETKDYIITFGAIFILTNILMYYNIQEEKKEIENLGNKYSKNSKDINGTIYEEEGEDEEY